MLGLGTFKITVACASEGFDDICVGDTDDRTASVSGVFVRGHLGSHTLGAPARRGRETDPMRDFDAPVALGQRHPSHHGLDLTVFEGPQADGRAMEILRRLCSAIAAVPVVDVQAEDHLDVGKSVKYDW